MENKILIPLDGTEQVSEIILYAQSITPRADTEISLLHVLPQAGAENAATAHIDEIMAVLTTAGWTVSSDLRMGDAVEEIVKFALLMPATLLLMSTHGRSGLEKIRQGSVTEQVLQHSPCPVFILHSSRAEPTDERDDNLFKRILVPLDGTDVSASILSCVERFSRAHDSEVILFHDEMDSNSPDEERAAVKLALQEHSVKLANAGLKVSLDMSTYRRPIREILSRIDEMKIDLVSMASHGESGVRRALDESVTAEVIRHSSCPLLVWSAEHQFPPLSGD